MTTPTHRELLIGAARAAGWTVVRWSDDGAGLLLEGIQEPFNSLTNKADAFDLMVRLHLTVRCYMGTTCAQATVPGGPTVYLEETDRANPTAATCIAITRAAHEISKGMR